MSTSFILGQKYLCDTEECALPSLPERNTGVGWLVDRKSQPTESSAQRRSRRPQRALLGEPLVPSVVRSFVRSFVTMANASAKRSAEGTLVTRTHAGGRKHRSPSLPRFLVLHCLSVAHTHATPLLTFACLRVELLPARQATEAFYRPFLLLINGVYLALVCYLSSRATPTAASTTTTTASTKGVSAAISIAATGVLWIVQYLCYQSILDDAALNRTGSATSSSSSSPLAGGVALDLLACMVVIQFAGIAWSPRAYWGLLLLPLVVAWQFYKTIRASLPSSSSSLMTSGAATAATSVGAAAQESTKPARRGNKNTKQR
jgi:SRP-independent targeting protein 2/TMEM208